MLRNSLAVPTMLRPSRNRPSPLFTNLLLQLRIRSAGVHVNRLRRLRDVAVELVGRDELALARVPGVEDLGGGGAPQDARVDEPGKFDTGDVSRGAVDSFKVPDCFCPFFLRSRVLALHSFLVV